LTGEVISIIIHAMNNNYSPRVYYERWLTPLLQSASQDHAVVILTGARQVGKSTLLRNAKPFCDWRFQTLDDLNVLEQAHKAPEGLWAGTDNIVLDEVQKAPALLVAIKQDVDRNPGRYHFVLSGSANLLLMKQVSESLAGRAVYFELASMAMGEIHKSPPPSILEHMLEGNFPEEGNVSETPTDPAEVILRGLMPALLELDTHQSWTRWWEGYVATYLERDLRQFAQIGALLDFRRMMELLALRSGQLVNQSEIARDALLAQPTVHRYMNLLETTDLFERLPVYMVSHTARLLKSPKAFFNDPGLAVFLSGYYDLNELRKAREYGSYFETFLHHHLQILARLMVPQGRLYFWRTRTGEEVDFVVEHGRHTLAVEVRQTDSPGFRDTAGLRAFLGEHPDTSVGLLAHCGREIKRLDKKIIAIPWTLLTG
jgi:predicted AAA+ superfamily ATPase